MRRVAEIIGAPPPALAARPALLPGLGSYLEAFNVLSGSRAVGFGRPPPIPLSEIESYCWLTAWRDPEAVAELVAVVQAMDAAYLEVTARRSGGEEIVARLDEEAGHGAWARVDRGARPDRRWSGRQGQK